MPQPRLSAEIMGWEALPAEARAAWPRLRALGGLEHPFFDLRYLDAAAQVAPHAQVAVLTEAGRGLAGLLPFQRRGGLIQPLGAPLSDYHGLLGDADPGQALAAVVRASGAQAFRFTGLRARQAPRGARQAHPSMVRDLGDGAPLILGPTAESAARAAKNLRRAERALERDVGPITFEWGPADARTIERVIRRKRLQYRRSGRHDVFACGWTAELLHLLARTGDAEFGLRAAVLRAGGRPVAAELGLLGAGAYHLWFPVYSRTLARYAPGMLMTLRTMEALREAGVRHVDFGAGAEPYKVKFARPSEPVFEGVARSRTAKAFSGALDAALAVGPASLGRLRLSMTRRLDVIDACETRAVRWWAGVSHAAAAAVRSRAFQILAVAAVGA